ncbi:uncharacterized protein LOC124305025 [Neodiprion virginianus]|uniref:uncharacterized protein LOC124305025 n=1 Tax=Neodiprion virginianus TaxID=2961670 RepID=UPI001EE6FEF2|nr:uncharacterized protein LOC124305025 [Neodiprion virginianus]
MVQGISVWHHKPEGGLLMPIRFTQGMVISKMSRSAASSSSNFHQAQGKLEQVESVGWKEKRQVGRQVGGEKEEEEEEEEEVGEHALELGKHVQRNEVRLSRAWRMCASTPIKKIPNGRRVNTLHLVCRFRSSWCSSVRVTSITTPKSSLARISSESRHKLDYKLGTLEGLKFLKYLL